MKSPVIGLAALGLLLSACSFAKASPAALTINLRFADGSNTYDVTSADVGHDVEVDVWATITGYKAPSSSNFFALQYAYFAIASSLPYGPSNEAGGGLNLGPTPDGNTAARVAPFNALGGQIGTLEDFNGDGVSDLGPTSTLAAGYVDYPKLRSSPATWSNFNLPTENLLPNGCEFEVEKLYFHVDSLTGEETDYQPVSVTLASPYQSANWAFDVPSYTIGSPLGAQYTQTSPALAGTGVDFVVHPASPGANIAVPEPTAGALIFASAGLTLLRRRKRISI